MWRKTIPISYTHIYIKKLLNRIWTPHLKAVRKVLCQLNYLRSMFFYIYLLSMLFGLYHAKVSSSRPFLSCYAISRSERAASLRLAVPFRRPSLLPVNAYHILCLPVFFSMIRLVQFFLKLSSFFSLFVSVGSSWPFTNIHQLAQQCMLDFVFSHCVEHDIGDAVLCCKRREAICRMVVITTAHVRYSLPSEVVVVLGNISSSTPLRSCTVKHPVSRNLSQKAHFRKRARARLKGTAQQQLSSGKPCDHRFPGGKIGIGR